ncbi:DUF4224 domain-containing protein [Paraburkholderia sediminicola]|uniref:DUF4224 domain-containing protein n=1 Tax=Paraburkholderia TaxID=1822464 RepID=UPI0038BC36C3
MEPRLMSDDDLATVTGKKRYSKQVAWFKQAFGIDVVCNARGRPVVTWQLYEALLAKRAGLAVDGKPPQRDVELCFD